MFLATSDKGKHKLDKLDQKIILVKKLEVNTVFALSDTALCIFGTFRYHFWYFLTQFWALTDTFFATF